MASPASPENRPPRQAIGLDVGGTKIAGGVVDENGRILHRLQVPTPSDQGSEPTLAALLDLVQRLRSEHPAVQAIGAGAAGMIEWPGGHIQTAPNNAYRDLPLQDLLAEHTGLASVVENDANAAAWAESRLGRGAGHRTVIVLTMGTGLGGGLVLDGALYRGHAGIGAELGHMLVDPQGVRCGCGSVGCLETRTSGTALGRMGREAARRDPAGTLASLAGGAENVTGETVFTAARQGDPAARSLFAELGRWLGMGVASLVNIFDPEIVVVSGGLVTAHEYFFPSALEGFHAHVFAGERRKLPPIVAAGLGPEAGLVGAALLALDAGGAAAGG